MTDIRSVSRSEEPAHREQFDARAYVRDVLVPRLEAEGKSLEISDPDQLSAVRRLLRQTRLDVDQGREPL